MNGNKKSPLIAELIKSSRRAVRLYNSHGILSANTGGEKSVHIRDTNFLSLFNEYKRKEHDYKYDRLFTVIDGVEFFCLVDKVMPQ